MLTIEDIRNPARKSGFDHVKGGVRGSAEKRTTSGGPGGAGWRAVVYGRPSIDKSGAIWYGRSRLTATDAAQDYCDYINGNPTATAATLRPAGHAHGLRAPLPRDEEVQHALGVLRDARAQRQGKPGYVYLIWEGQSSGGLRYGKIGYSTNPEARVAELQTGNPRTLVLLYKKPGTEADEAALHQKYIQNNVLQEWFFITKDLLLEFNADHAVNDFPATMSRAS